MWANFGPAVQVKHINLKSKNVEGIVDQIESDHIVVVCRDADEEVISIFTKQISWGQRVRGIVTESHLIDWYNRCLRGQFSDRLAEPLLERLRNEFVREFPHTLGLEGFLKDRGYDTLPIPPFWTVPLEEEEEE
jgi:type II restriction enzyme